MNGLSGNSNFLTLGITATAVIPRVTKCGGDITW